MSEDKLPLKLVLEAFDKNDKDVYDMLPDNLKKQVGFWLLNRYMSSVTGSRAQQENAVIKTNEIYNKNWNSLGTRHPKLQWQLLCVSGNTGKTEFHKWIGLKKQGSNSKIVKFIESLYPELKTDEVELLARISTKKELQELARNHGIDAPKF